MYTASMILWISTSAINGKQRSHRNWKLHALDTKMSFVIRFCIIHMNICYKLKEGRAEDTIKLERVFFVRGKRAKCFLFERMGPAVVSRYPFFVWSMGKMRQHLQRIPLSTVVAAPGANYSPVNIPNDLQPKVAEARHEGRGGAFHLLIN